MRVWLTVSQFVVHSAAEQVARHLRGEIQLGIKSGSMPGGHRLAQELGVNHKTVEAALRLLENEGILVSRGAGRRRSIVAPEGNRSLRSIRIALLPMESRDSGRHYLVALRHLLEEAGHVPIYMDKSLLDLGMSADRVGRFVKRTEADAWLVCAGSKEVLQWFSQQPMPAFALFGRRDGIPIASAGPDKVLPMTLATRHLIERGHRRISFLVRKQQRLPDPTPSVRAFLDELEAHGVDTGDFNLPDWEESAAGYQEILESLFRLTPPTALIIDEAFLFIAAQQFLGKHGLRVPEDVSLICTDNDRTFDWCEPSIAHIGWDSAPVVRRIVRWAANVSQGKQDLRQTSTKAEFIDGGSVGPAKER